MKKLIYVMTALLTLAFYSCSSDDGPDESGGPGAQGPNENSKKTSEVKAVLCAINVWKMDYQGTSFYFEFKDDGTVISTPGKPFYLKEEVNSSYALDYNGDEQVLLTIEGSGAIKYLTSGIESTLVIADYSSEKITATGWTTKSEMILIPASGDEWSTVKAEREEEGEKYKIIQALKDGFTVGLLRNDEGHFVAHYKLAGIYLDQIVFTYLDDRELQHDSYDLFIVPGADESEFILKFESVSFGGHELSEIYFNNSTKEISIESVLVLDLEYNSAVSYYMEGYSHMHKIDFTPVCGFATPRLMQELEDAQVDEIDLDDRNPRNIIFCSGGGPFQWVGYKVNLWEDPNEPGHVYFTREPFYFPVNDSGHGGEYVEESCSQVLSAFFDAEGFYMFREEVGESSFLYMVSPVSDIWFQWEWRPGV